MVVVNEARNVKGKMNKSRFTGPSRGTNESAGATDRGIRANLARKVA